LGLQATSIISSAVMPEFSIAMGSSEAEPRQRLFAFNLLSSVILLGGALVFLLLFGGTLTHLWLVGTARPGFWLLALLALGAALQGLWQLSANLLMAANRQYMFTPVFVLISLAMVGLGMLIVPAGGTTAMAAALCAAELAMVLWVYRQAARAGFGTPRTALSYLPMFRDSLIVLIGRIRKSGRSAAGTNP
jgi:O-antigen/teichoic acid export membrane protein